MIWPAHREVRVHPLPGPIDLMAAVMRLGAERRMCLLESSAGPWEIARYSFLCVDPVFVLESKRGRTRWGLAEDPSEFRGTFFEGLEEALKHFGALSEAPRDAQLPPFLGGFVGALGYELLHELEEVADLGEDGLALPDASLFVPGALVAIDHQAERAWLISHGFGGTKRQAGDEASRREATWLERLGDLPPCVRPSPRFVPREAMTEQRVLEEGFTPVISREAYLELVQAAREEIFAGNVFELCTTTRFDAKDSTPGPELFSALRRLHPAPFSAYLRIPNAEVLCASPERFLTLDSTGWAETRPIKGTRPRGRTDEEDAQQRAALANSEKDRAENVMIVDLARNDLGRVCELGSVTVPKLFDVESHPFTHQLVSTVRGKLKAGLGAVELLRAAFPGGSMTGAPKIEAMRIIERLEKVDRGLYSGSLGYFDFSGAFDLNITIRTLIKNGDRLVFHVGGAVVADSDPADEYQEILDKAHGLIAAVHEARRRS